MHWEFSFTPTEAEQLRGLACIQGKLLQSAHSHWRTRAWTTTIALLGGMAGFLAMVLGDGAAPVAGSFFLYGMLGALLLQTLYAVTLTNVSRKIAIAADPTVYIGPRSVRFDDQGVFLSWEHGQQQFRWDAFSGVVRQGEMHALMAGAQYLLLPDRLFASDDQRRDWQDYVTARLITQPPKPRDPSIRANFSRGASALSRTLLTNLGAGSRMLLLQPVKPLAKQASPGAILVLVAGWMALHVIADGVVAGSAGSFTPEGLPGLLYPLALTSIAALLATVLGRCPERFATLFALILAIALPLAAIVLALQVLDLKFADEDTERSRQVGQIAAVWLALASTVAIARSLRFGRVQRVTLLIGLLAMLAWPLASVQPYDSIWALTPDREETDDGKYDALSREEVFYQQPRLLAQTLGGLAPQTPGATDLYFIGVGGDAEQGVFLREVRSVAKLMGERFDIANRSVVLINNYQSAMDYPIASVTALDQSLRRISELMDRDQDILFLYLTSHGSRDHEFLLDFWPLKFKPLNPAVLRQMLDAAGIRWRVIVISACYSGGYIEPLRDDRSIVITAAAADKTSFGCSDENDWTYFGRAFFDQALDEANGDLDQAFATARDIILERETEEGIDEASNPQIASGNEMQRKWRAFLDQRQTSTESAKPSP